MPGFQDILAQTSGTDVPALNSGQAMLPPEMLQALMARGLNPNATNTPDQKSEALMRLGFGMLQPVQRGQSPAGNIGKAMEGSINYLDVAKRRDQEMAMKQATMASTMANQDSQRRTADMNRQKMEAMFPTEWAILQADKDIKKVKQTEAAMLMENGAEQLAARVKAETEALGLTPKVRLAQINASNASAGASSAAAANARARLPGIEQDVAAKTYAAGSAQRLAEITGKMSDEELLAYTSGTGKFAKGTSVTAVGASQSVAKDIYSRLPADSALRSKYKSSAEFESAFINKKVGTDDLKLVASAYGSVDDMPPAVRREFEARVSELLGIKSGPTGGGIPPEMNTVLKARLSPGQSYIQKDGPYAGTYKKDDRGNIVKVK